MVLLSGLSDAERILTDFCKYGRSSSANVREQHFPDFDRFSNKHLQLMKTKISVLGSGELIRLCQPLEEQWLWERGVVVK